MDVSIAAGSSQEPDSSLVIDSLYRSPSMRDYPNWLDGQEVTRGELVFGIVGALGTNIDSVEAELKVALAAVHYSSKTVRISELIDRIEFNSQSDGINEKNNETHLDRLMNKGDQLREKLQDGAAAARLAVAEIFAERGQVDADNDQAFEQDREDRATIIRQFKHEEEVELLRRTYGPRFVLVGVWSPTRERSYEVSQRLQTFHPDKDKHWRAQQVSRLMERDEKDSRSSYGQRVRATFELADCYVSVKSGSSPADQLKRLIRLLFGHPWETPSWLEMGMYHASAASLRSADAGRQVGAVILDEDFEVLATGANEVPKAGGGQYWGHEQFDHRDFQSGFDANHRLRNGLITDVLSHLRKAGWLAKNYGTDGLADLADRAINGPLAGSQVVDIIEFGRIAHAEMAAISTAARRGTPIRGGVLLTTTYPCHECARIIIASGIIRVVYIDPYPKSRVSEMYRHEVSDEGTQADNRVAFDPYEGVAPSMFARLFTMIGRNRDTNGSFKTWEPSNAQPRLSAAQPLYRMSVSEYGVAKKLYADLKAAGIDQSD